MSSKTSRDERPARPPHPKRARGPRAPTTKTRAAAILKILRATYPDAHCELDHEGPFQLLVATILSAQCTDVRVNLVTPALFRKYPDAQSLAAAKQEDVEDLIRSTGFFRNKAKNLIAAAQALVGLHHGEVPRDLEPLTHLPGVGRKTANVVLGNAYGMNIGVVVDTHVSRLSQRLGLSKATTPEKIETDLMRLIPREKWALFSHWLIWHGRRRCVARKPRCSECELAKLCPSVKIAGKDSRA